MKKTLKKRNSIIVAICIFSFVLFLSVFYVGQSLSAFNKQVRSIVEKEMRNSIATFSEVLQTIDNSALVISVSRQLLQLDDGSIDYSSIKDFNNTVKTVLSTNDYILKATVLNKGGIVYNDNNQYLYYATEDADTHSAYSNGMLKTVYSTDSKSNELCFITDADGDFKTNSVVFILDQKDVGTNVFRNSGDDLEFITDGAGKIVLSDNMSDFGKKVSDIVSSEFYETKDGDKIKTAVGEKYKFTEKIPNTDMQLVYMVSPDSFNSIRQQFILSTSVVVFAILVCAFLVSATIFKISYQPINEILTSINNSKTSGEDSAFNEVDYIKKNFEAMMTKNRDLEENVISKTVLLHQMQMQALQMQICPHFLYNTLNTINCLSYEQLQEYDNPISKTVCITADMMRCIGDVGNQFLTIAQELDYTKKYVELLNIRYRNQFKVTYDVDEELLKQGILKCIIQPFVENVSIHAFGSSNMDDARINISVKKYNNRIVISITDNGKGMSEENIKHLREAINKFEFGNGRHIGIRNINMRIKILYGEDYGVEIESELGKGSVFRIVMPFVDLEK